MRDPKKPVAPEDSEQDGAEYEEDEDMDLEEDDDDEFDFDDEPDPGDLDATDY